MVTKKQDWNVEAGRLLRLFASNERSVGRFHPADGKVHTEYRAPNSNDWLEHLNGTQGVGCVAIRDDNTCMWAALDIDNHGADDDIPIVPVDEKIRASKLPLIPCRSKSGGIHAYVFFDKPQPASRVRVIMARWAELVGYGGCEVFPKQSVLLAGKDGGKSLGNWINMPYMAGADTQRYAYRDGKKLSVVEFLDYVDKHKCTDSDITNSISFDHPHAPPCVQKMMAQGVASGQRNEAMFNVTIYLRKAFPDGFEARAKDLNGAIFDKPLPRSELMRTINSAGRPDYSYRCGEEPMRSLCDKESCLKREHGISKTEYDTLEAAQSLPQFSDLSKYMSEPVRWGIKIGDIRIENIHTEVLLEWKAIRQIVAERLTKILPMIKNQEWERILAPLMADARIIDTPDDASIPGIMREKLREFAQKANLDSKGEDTAERKALLRGLPCVQMHQGERAVMFRAQDFQAYLKRTKTEALRGVDLWLAIKEIGVYHTKLRAGESNINVWCIPVVEVMKSVHEAAEPKFESKL